VYVNDVVLPGDIMSVPVGVLPAALAGQAGGSPPSDVPPELLEAADPLEAPEPLVPVEALEAADPLEAPAPLAAPLPVTGVPELPDRELHPTPAAPSASRQVRRGRRALQIMCSLPERADLTPLIPS
jgi:hypothetical protein